MLEAEGPRQALLWVWVCQPQGSRLPAACRVGVGQHRQLWPSPAFRPAFCLRLLYPHSWASLQSALSPPRCGVSPQCRRRTGSLSIYDGRIVVDRPPAVFQVASDALPKSVPMITSPIPPTRRSRSKLPLCPTAKCSFSCAGSPGIV